MTPLLLEQAQLQLQLRLPHRLHERLFVRLNGHVVRFPRLGVVTGLPAEVRQHDPRVVRLPRHLPPQQRLLELLESHPRHLELVPEEEAAPDDPAASKPRVGDEECEQGEVLGTSPDTSRSQDEEVEQGEVLWTIPDVSRSQDEEVEQGEVLGASPNPSRSQSQFRLETRDSRERVVGTLGSLRRGPVRVQGGTRV